jgi:antitoxin component of MazEF toxin-antitoxin module
MKVSIIDIGNSKGIRIPQAVLKQVAFAEEAELEVAEGKIILRRLVDPSQVPEFASLAAADDQTIQRVLRKVSGADLITALVGAEDEVKQAVYRNMSGRAGAYVKSAVARMERGDARDLIIERSRNAVSQAFLDVIGE